jgi:hypothetical protein
MLYTCNTLFFCSLGWHHRLNMKAGGIGLLFYRLVPVLRNEAVTAEQNAQLVRDGVAGRRLRKSYQKVQKLLESYGSCMMKMLSQLQNYWRDVGKCTAHLFKLIVMIVMMWIDNKCVQSLNKWCYLITIKHDLWWCWCYMFV